jgi:hypothetical protein
MRTVRPVIREASLILRKAQDDGLFCVPPRRMNRPELGGKRPGERPKRKVKVSIPKERAFLRG